EAARSFQNLAEQAQNVHTLAMQAKAFLAEVRRSRSSKQNALLALFAVVIPIAIAMGFELIRRKFDLAGIHAAFAEVAYLAGALAVGVNKVWKRASSVLNRLQTVYSKIELARSQRIDQETAPQRAEVAKRGEEEAIARANLAKADVAVQ